MKKMDEWLNWIELRWVELTWIAWVNEWTKGFEMTWNERVWNTLVAIIWIYNDIYVYIHTHIYIYVYIYIYWPAKTRTKRVRFQDDSGSVATDPRPPSGRNPIRNPLESGEFYVGRIRRDPPTRFLQFLDNVENMQVDANYMVVVCRFLCDLRVARHLQTCYARHSGTPVGHVNLFRIESGCPTNSTWGS